MNLHWATCLWQRFDDANVSKHIQQKWVLQRGHVRAQQPSGEGSKIRVHRGHLIFIASATASKRLLLCFTSFIAVSPLHRFNVSASTTDLICLFLNRLAEHPLIGQGSSSFSSNALFFCWQWNTRYLEQHSEQMKCLFEQERPFLFSSRHISHFFNHIERIDVMLSTVGHPKV